jgi:Na+/H+ antiporter NhaD/arsenite permease-like protein
MTAHWTGLLSIANFVVAYVAVAAEERLHLRKSVPVLAAAGIIWVLVGVGLAGAHKGESVAELARHNLLEYGEVLLFLIVATTYVNTLGERRVFDAVRAYLVGRGLSLRSLFWATGAIAFARSPSRSARGTLVSSVSRASTSSSRRTRAAPSARSATSPRRHAAVPRDLRADGRAALGS